MQYKSLFIAVLFVFTMHINAQVSFIDGITNPEDLVSIKGSDWVIVSSMAPDSLTSGKIYGLNIKNHQTMVLFDLPLRNTSNIPQLTRFAPHGIYIRNVASNNYLLYVVNHGNREAVEIFKLYFDKEFPKLIWQKHITFPKNVWANGLVADSKGKIYVTSMYDPNDTAFLEKFERKSPTGQVWEWNEYKGWKPFNTTWFSGGNGIAISPVEDCLYVSEWAGQKIHRISLNNQINAVSINVDFLPDNIRWSSDEKLIVTGQKGSPTAVFSSKHPSKINSQFKVIEVDQGFSYVKELINGNILGFGNGTVTIELKKSYLVGCVLYNKIAVYQKP